MSLAYILENCIYNGIASPAALRVLATLLNVPLKIAVFATVNPVKYHTRVS